MVKLKKLLKLLPEAHLRGSAEVEISGVCANSQRVAPGNLFIAKQGIRTHGALYLHAAIAGGAAAVVTDLYDPSLPVPQLIVPDPAAVEGLLASEYYGTPASKLLLVGVTGTNGKTTTSYLVKHLLDAVAGPCGLTGTIEYFVGRQSYPATHTTSDNCTNQKLLREMLLSGCRSAVMEVTSHALVQRRVDKIPYDIAIYTNLSPEHLDYHKTIEEYCAAKNLLFQKLGREGKKAWAIINNDCSWSEKVCRGHNASLLTYGIDGGELTASAIIPSADGIAFTLNYRGLSLPTQIPLIGRHNVYNALAASGAALAAGATLCQIQERLPSSPSIPGRLEPIPNDLSIRLYVDFAHTPDALEKALSTLQSVNSGKIITVFGCGGDRDRLKRPLMGAVSERYSSFTLITNDNPRSEEPQAIADQILAGFQDKSRALLDLDRRSAIARAIDYASPGDVVLIAGKGHETTQIFAHQTTPFDDRVEARQQCQRIVS